MHEPLHCILSPAAIFSLKNVNELMEESLKMKALSHPNILSIIGVSIDSGDSPYIVMPYMVNGSLLSFLRKERPTLTIAEEATSDLVSFSKINVILHTAQKMCSIILSVQI